MNRRERRAATARARGRQTGYLHRVLAATMTGAIPTTPGVRMVTIEHDPGCAIYRRAGCDCVPDISVSNADGVTIVDERGVGRKVARQ
jgi:hypothetical protein